LVWKLRSGKFVAGASLFRRIVCLETVGRIDLQYNEYHLAAQANLQRNPASPRCVSAVADLVCIAGIVQEKYAMCMSLDNRYPFPAMAIPSRCKFKPGD
jgi:hypothetical protein